jgi:hypothetical protein
MTSTTAPRYCHLCGRPLGRQHVWYEGGLCVCSRCHRSRPHCARCGVPFALGGADEHGEPGAKQYCARCLREAPRCACCSEVIAHHFFTFDALLPATAARRYCEECVASRPRCDVCHAPVPSKATLLADGQYRCDVCARDMVLGAPAVRAVYAEAIHRARVATGLALAAEPDLHAVGRRAMGRLRQRVVAGDDVAGTARHVLGLFVREGQQSAVYVEFGLPRPLLLATLAHELAHAWQSETTLPLGDPMLREGFAEWVAHRVLVDGGHRDVAVRATRRDDTYGSGLRYFLALERKEGRAAVLAAGRGAGLEHGVGR